MNSLKWLHYGATFYLRGSCIGRVIVWDGVVRQAFMSCLDVYIISGEIFKLIYGEWEDRSCETMETIGMSGEDTLGHMVFMISPMFGLR